MKHESEPSRPERNSADGGPAEVDPAIERQIDENLRLIYRQCLEEGIPDALQALVDQLGEKTKPS